MGGGVGWDVEYANLKLIICPMKASCCSNVKSNIVKRIGTAMVVGLRQLNNKIIRHVWARTFSTSNFKMANESASKKMGMSFPHFGTLAIHAGQDPEQWNSRAVVPPISMSSTFKQDAPGVHRVRENYILYSFTWAILFYLENIDNVRSYFFFRDLSILAPEIRQGIALKLALQL